MKKSRLAATVPIVVSFLVWTTGCDNKDDGPDTSATADAATDSGTTDVHEHVDSVEHDPLEEAAEHGCVHFQTGPFGEVTAAATAGDAPEIHAGHELFVVTLVDFGGGHGGYLKLDMSEAGEVLFMLSKPVTVAVTTASGAAVAPAHSPDLSGVCSAIASASVHHLEAAGEYLIELGPSDGETKLDLLIEALGEHDHDHDAR